MGSKERKEREKELRRTQILDAAREVLLQKGIAGTAVAGIAKLAELSVGTIYVYFAGKEEIFAALQEEGISILSGMIHEAAEGENSTGERLLEIAGAYFRFRIERANYFDIINYFLTTPEIVFPDDLKKRIDDLAGGVLGELEKVIARGMERKEIFHHSSRECAVAYWGLLHGLLQFGKLRDTMLGVQDFRSFYLRAAKDFIGGLRRKRG